VAQESYAPTAMRRLPSVRAIVGVDVWARGWRATVHLAAGFPLAACAVVVLLPLSVLGVVTLPALLACNRLFTRWQRARFAQCLGVHIAPDTDRFTNPTRLGRLLAEARSTTTWRQYAYHLFAALLGTVGFAVCVAGWAFGLPLALIGVFSWTLPDQNSFGWSLHDPAVLVGLTTAGLALCLGALRLAAGVARIDAAAATALLGPSRSEVLTRRVASLTESRAALLEAADTERRRIERDLHDGAQQRLTALAMNLGMLRQSAGDLPEPVRAEITRAHGDAKQALIELRSLVRGLHPAVLDARGLDAALSGLAASSPVPVRVAVDVQRRPPSAVEAVTYFVVSEALTNIARHSGARGAEIRLWTDGDRLRLRIVDDGRGGARPEGGSGLRGLRQRVATVDGTLHVHSPAGGGTTITVEVPCGS
jgi:signal transduction histidine kinase